MYLYIFIDFLILFFLVKNQHKFKVLIITIIIVGMQRLTDLQGQTLPSQSSFVLHCHMFTSIEFLPTGILDLSQQNSSFLNEIYQESFYAITITNTHLMICSSPSHAWPLKSSTYNLRRLSFHSIFISVLCILSYCSASRLNRGS